MPEENVKISLPNFGMVEGVPVSVEESVERWTELKLADGSVLRIKPQVIRVIRANGKYDPEGNPLYIVQGGQMMVVTSVPAHLKQPRGLTQ